MKRRAFLQRTGLALAALNASQLGLSPLVKHYHQALADPTPRKLALLVGINQYRNAALMGCVTDVDLQRELLTHRFGFHPSDVLTLTDQQATRDAIETAFITHLIEQARPGDVVIVHFSGYGGRVVGTAPDIIRTSLVTVDEPVAEGDNLIVNDVLEDTLLLLLRSLQTNKVTTVLDTSYSYPGKSLQGNLRIRARPIAAIVRPSEAELAFQEQLLSQSSTDRERLGVQRRSGQLPGVVLSAAGVDQLATEAKWNGFSAGLFTYALTQQLWQTAPSTALRIVLGRAREQVEQLAYPEQQPQLSGQNVQEQALQPYHLATSTSPPADGVVTEVEETGKTVRLWLGGVPAAVIEQYGVNSLLTLVDESSGLQLQLVSRDGLLAKAKVYSSEEKLSGTDEMPPVRVGQVVREHVRVLPRNVGLTVALDRSLERIERVDAVSAFSAIPRISSAIAGEQSADYLFSKVQTSPTQLASLSMLPGIAAANPSVSQSSYGLFSLGQEVIPNTAGENGEAVKVAVRRLVPKLQTLLAAKLLSLTANEGSSQLPVRATLQRVDTQIRSVLQRETIIVNQGSSTKEPVNSAVDGLVKLAVGSRIQYRLENRGTQPIYFILLGLDSSGNLTALHSPPVRAALQIPQGTDSSGNSEPSVASTEPASTRLGSVAPGESITLPQASATFQWVLHNPTGLTETYLITSRAPFTQTLAALESSLRSAGDAPTLYSPTNPLEVAQAVLQDLHQASGLAEAAAPPPETYVLDVKSWASLRFVYQIV